MKILTKVLRIKTDKLISYFNEYIDVEVFAMHYNHLMGSKVIRYLTDSLFKKKKQKKKHELWIKLPLNNRIQCMGYNVKKGHYHLQTMKTEVSMHIHAE